MNPPFAIIRTQPKLPRPEGVAVRHIATIRHEIFGPMDIWLTDDYAKIIVCCKQGTREFNYNELQVGLPIAVYNDFLALAILGKQVFTRGMEIYRDQTENFKNKRYNLQDGVEYAAQQLYKVFAVPPANGISDAQAETVTGC